MQNKRILIIDDEPFIREIAQISLEMVSGYQVLTAPSGREGLAIARQEHLDAILLDVMMPEMDGPTTYAKLQDDPVSRGIPVILLTARASRTPIGEEGVVAVIAKPFDPMTLAHQVASALGWENPA